LLYIVVSWLQLVPTPVFGAEITFHGISDVSAAVFLDDAHFVVADDETNFFRIYKTQKHDRPVSTINLNGFLEPDDDHPEADIEGAARVGDRIYWITSHGRNKDGKMRSSRYRFFCTRIVITGDEARVAPMGRICSTLIRQFLTQPSPVKELLVSASQLDADLSGQEREQLAPKANGLNIEGLCSYRPNQSLLIGLRNPLYEGKAIVLELRNPQSLVDQGFGARFGRVLFWDLQQRGIRGIEFSSQENVYYILAGGIDSEKPFALYRWDGDIDEQPVLLHVWDDDDSFGPEGIAVRAADGLLWLFSDDGSLEIPVDSAADCLPGELLDNGNCPNKHLVDPDRKTFRVRTFTSEQK